MEKEKKNSMKFNKIVPSLPYQLSSSLKKKFDTNQSIKHIPYHKNMYWITKKTTEEKKTSHNRSIHKNNFQ